MATSSDELQEKFDRLNVFTGDSIHQLEDTPTTSSPPRKKLKLNYYEHSDDVYTRARVVLGYLYEEKFIQTFFIFLDECPDLSAVKSSIEKSSLINLSYNGFNLTSLLHDYMKRHDMIYRATGKREKYHVNIVEEVDIQRLVLSFFFEHQYLETYKNFLNNASHLYSERKRTSKKKVPIVLWNRKTLNDVFDQYLKFLNYEHENDISTISSEEKSSDDDVHLTIAANTWTSTVKLENLRRP